VVSLFWISYKILDSSFKETELAPEISPLLRRLS